MSKTLTKTNGNIIIEDIKIGDIQYEYLYDYGIKSEVLTLPRKDNNGLWNWKNRNVNTNDEINYAVSSE